MKLVKGTLISNRYDIQSKIGSGGMAVVYKALDRKLDRVVTLKVMREEHIEDDEFIQRFNVEARAAARLNHPNIVKVYDVGRFQNIYYIVMEYIDGVTLKDLTVTRGLFTSDEILGVAIQITSAISHAHEHGIIHRDVKPQNILVTTSGEVKVTDFGIAMAVNSQTEELGENTIGSVHYFSPEQARGSNVDEKSDIYSIGITMFEMACGHPPFDDDTVVAIAVKHINEELPNIYDYNEEISESVVEIIETATQKAKINRYSNANEMNNALKRALTYETGEIYSNVQDFSKTNTLHLSEEDVKKIKEEAINAFYNEGDTIFEFSDTSFEEKQDKVFKLAILTVIIIMLMIAITFFNNFRNQITEVVEVPNFERMLIDDAMEEAYRLGFELKIVREEYSEDYEVNTVIEQDYEKGDTVYSGGEVKVSISLGSDKVEVPYVEGKTIDEGVEAFSLLPFKIDEVYIYDDLIPINDIVEQSPSGGTKLEAGETITLYVSRGKEERVVMVPDVRTKTENQAIASITSRNLKIGEVIGSYSNTVEEGVVMSQTIPGGREVAPGTSINIVVSLGKEEVEPEPEDEEPKPEEPQEPQEEDNEEVDVADLKEDVVTINTLYLSQGQTSAQVKLLEVTSTGTKIVYENVVTQSELPIQIPVKGTGTAEYQMYIRNDDDSYTMVASTFVDFTESE